MAKYLDETGLKTLWSKIKALGTGILTTVGSYTINGKAISGNPTLSKSDVGLGNVENVKAVPASEKGAKSGVATLDANGYVPLGQLGNLDTTFAEVVTALPTSGIKKHLYLLKSSDTSQNLYSEYLYTGDVSATYDASKWEKLGEYKADVDLSGYAKKSEALSNLVTAQDATKATLHKSTVSGSMSDVYITSATSSAAGVMSAADKAKLDGIASGANKYSLPTASASALGGIKVGDNLSISAEGVLSGTADTHYSSKNVVAGTANQTSNSSGTGTVYLNHIESTGLTSSHAIKSGQNVLVSSDDNGNITIQSTNTYVKNAAFTGGEETVTMTLTMNDGSTVTADIPTLSEGTTGLPTASTWAYISGSIQELQNVMPAEKDATADSAITASELAAILV